MARYEHFEIPDSPETPWYFGTSTIVSVNPNKVVLANPDGTQTHLNGRASDLAYDPVTDTLTGTVWYLDHTDASGTTLYERLEELSVSASAFYPDGTGVLDLLVVSADFMLGWSGKDVIIGGDSDDYLFTRAGADVLIGGEGHDALFAGDDNDLLDGGTGLDQMSGGAGDDIYVLRRGDGVPGSSSSETIADAYDEGFDTIRIEGMAPADVSISFHPEHGWFRLGIPDTAGTVLYTDVPSPTFSDIGTTVGRCIEQIVFDDGTVWDLTGALNYTGTGLLYGSPYGDTVQTTGPSSIVYGGTGNDVLRGGDGNDEFYAGAGNDLLEGGGGNDGLYANGGPQDEDVLRGGEGDDTLFAGGLGHNDLDGGAGHDWLVGGDGADVLVGGADNDQMDGGGGDDTYVIRAGEGGGGTFEDWELVDENRGAGLDTIYLEGLTPADVKLSMSPIFSDSLRLELKAPDGSSSFVEFWGDIGGTPGSYGERVELIRFGDGTAWDLRNGLPPLDDHAPEAVADSYTLEAGETLIIDAAHGILANDSDADGDSLTLTWLSGPSHGTIVRNADGSFSYTPTAGFTGEDGLAYKIEANGLFDTGQVTFTVTPAEPDAPVAADDGGFVTPADTPWTIAAADLLANDTDADGDTLSITAVSDAVGGTVALDASGNPVFTPDAGFSGPASFRYTVSDGGLTSTAQVQLTVEERGNSGDDILSGGLGDDTLDGGAGEDKLSGGNGLDRLNGGTGNDALSGGNGADQLFGDSGDDALDGGNGDDLIEGGSGKDVLTAGNGADRLAGGVGDDVLSGGNGDDQLDGGDGADSLSGGNGADRLLGGAGADILTGGNGGDRFVFKVGFGSDVIADLRLSGASQDRIAFEDGIFDSMADMLSHAADTAGGVLIATDAADALLIRNTTAAQLAANPEDFFFS